MLRIVTARSLVWLTLTSPNSRLVGNAVEIVGHFQVGIVDDVVDPIAAAVADDCDAGGGKVVGVDMVGEYIVAVDQRRCAFLPALQRQAVGGVDAGRPQDRHGDAGAPPPGAQGLLGGDTPAGARTFGMAAAGFVDPGAATIAIDAGGANVDQAAW